jgi:hypothetical protein
VSARWERLLDQKPVSLLDHLIREAAQLIAADFLRWPLEVEAEPGSPGVPPADQPRPAPTVYREAVRLARWDVASELDAYDDYMRNRRYLEQGLTEADRPLLLLLNRWLVEQMLVLGEHTQGRVNRQRKLACLDAIGRALPPM